jgi:hypothetical protein
MKFLRSFGSLVDGVYSHGGLDCIMERQRPGTLEALYKPLILAQSTITFLGY